MLPETSSSDRLTRVEERVNYVALGTDEIKQILKAKDSMCLIHAETIAALTTICATNTKQIDKIWAVFQWVGFTVGGALIIGAIALLFKAKGG